MQQLMEKSLAIIEGFTEKSGRLVAMLTILMMLIMVSTVLARYLFGIGSIALQETSMYLHAMIFMLGAAYTLKHNDHVRVDIFYRQFSPRQKSMVDLAGTLLFLLPVSAFIAIESIEYVKASWLIRESSVDPGGLAWVYLLKSLLLVMPVLLIAQGLAEVLKNTLVLMGMEISDDEDHARDKAL